MPRSPWFLAAGFPADLAEVYRARALDGGHAVAEVRELDRPVEGLPRRREVVRAWLPVGPSPGASSSDAQAAGPPNAH